MAASHQESPSIGAAADPRVLLVDDHTLFRRGLRRLLEQGGVEVVGEGSNGRAGVQLAAELRPDVVVMDLSMPLMSGVEAIEHIIHANPKALILVLTVTEEGDDVLDALLAGACGYLLKDARGEDILAGIRAAIAGGSMISPRIAGRLVGRLREVARPTPPCEVGKDLTEREVEILRLIASGKENVAIARELFISPKTVKNHVATILDKLAIENRVQAAVVAVRSGLA
jgi:two-component system, NarL family, nitrate/nitrite response regulator NarL